MSVRNLLDLLVRSRSVLSSPVFPCCVQVYLQLHEQMKDQTQQPYWEETGRWAGYEENFDPHAGVWASPHVSYLTFKSLIQLRRTMNTGQ